VPQLRYSVAASLDGYIAGPNGEYDWIPMDEEIDFAALWAGFGGIVMGRRSYDVFLATGAPPGPRLPVHVCSRHEPEGPRKDVTFIRDAVSGVRALKTPPGDKPLWLWGGGALFQQLADAGLVDGVDVAILPIVLGGGIPFIATPAQRLPLVLRRHRVYATTGTVMLEYDVRSA
jgi:dihydrofolate reductase